MSKDTNMPQRSRPVWIVSLVLCAGLGYGAVAWISKVQWNRNTQRILKLAQAAHDAGNFDHALEAYVAYLEHKPSDAHSRPGVCRQSSFGQST